MSINAVNSEKIENRAANPLTFSRAILAGGIVISWSYFNPSSAFGYLSTIVIGVAGSFFAKKAVDVLLEMYDKSCHRISGPLLLKETSHEYQENANAAFQKIKLHKDYPLFKELQCNSSDKSCYQFFKRMLSKGYCMGSTIALLQTIANKENASCPELLKGMDIADIFYYQSLQFIQAAYQSQESKVRECAWRTKSAKHLFDRSIKNEYRPFNDKYPEANINDTKLLEILEMGKNYKHIISGIQKELVSWEELESESFSAKESIKVFQQQFEQLIGNSNRASGRIVITGDENDREKGRDGHVMTFQRVNEKFRFYDTIDASDGGFYEYSSSTEFLKALQKQILNGIGTLNYNNILIKFCLRKETL